MNLLEVQSSVRAEKSISRTLSHEFIQTWQNFHPDGRHQQRDVGLNPPAHPTELFMPDEIRQQSIEQARTKLMSLAATW